MAISHQYFWSKWTTSIQAMTPLHSGTVNRLKSETDHHWWGFHCKCMLIILLSWGEVISTYFLCKYTFHFLNIFDACKALKLQSNKSVQISRGKHLLDFKQHVQVYIYQGSAKLNIYSYWSSTGVCQIEYIFIMKLYRGLLNWIYILIEIVRGLPNWIYILTEAV